MSRGFSIKGDKELIAAIKVKAKHQAVDRIVKQNTIELMSGAKWQAAAKFTGHMEGNRFVSPTGTAKRSIRMTMDGSMSGTVAYGVDYAYYLEHGTRFMTARPTMGPAFMIQKSKFIADLKRLV